MQQRQSNRRQTLGILAALCAMAAASITAADIKLPAIFGDHMVLQQQTDAPIWGWAEPGQAVTVSADWLAEPVSTTAASDGTWRVKLPTPGAGGPHTLTVTGQNTITFADILIGEVWICSGQSNMEWPLRLTEDAEREIAAANHPQIRLFDVARELAVSPKSDCKGQWQVCLPDTTRQFSAVGYFFGRELHQTLGVPVGLIGTNWGGTVSEAWTSADGLRTHGDFDETLAVLKREQSDPGALERAGKTAIADWWKALGTLEAQRGMAWWRDPHFNDTDWPTMNIPRKWEQTPTLESFDGVLWFRRTLDLPVDWAGRALTLHLGPIDDMDTVWFNGTRIGGVEESGKWYQPREYTVPAGLAQAGPCVIAIRVSDIGGAGGLCGKAEMYTLRPSNADNEQARSLAGPWRYQPGVALDELPDWPRWTRLHANLPTVLFNGMIHPLVPYAIRGAIWYQGESNRSRAAQYRTLFPALIADWRRVWNRGDFPFYFVQIAPYNYLGDTGQTAELQEAQRLALSTPNTGMAVTTDIGNVTDIHPRNKRDVGHRLALWALAKTYGKPDVTFSGPLYKSMKIEGGRVRLSFDFASGGLTAAPAADADKAGELKHFVIAGADRNFVPAPARIDGDTVVVWSPAIPEPVAVRYCWGTTNQGTLFNNAGLPAPSFRTDSWQGVVTPETE